MKKLNIAVLAAGVCAGLVAGVAATFSFMSISSSESRESMKMEFGIRMTREDGVSIFGVDEIQARLKEGAVITALQCKGANFQKTGEDGEHVSLYFSGGSFEIELSDNSQLDAIGN